MDFSQELRYLESTSQLKGTGKFTFIKELSARAGKYEIPTDSFYREITRNLLPLGLYQHQIEAIRAIEEGHNVVVATSTSSGKSLCYQLPIAKALLSSKKRSQRPKALVIHPTKALGQDQLKSWSKLKIPGISVSTFDGDSSSAQRISARKFADVWLSNPEMVNHAILANHGQYHSLLSGLDYVVVDEAHVYRGIFGSHVANLFRRLIRIAKLYGSAPQFIFTSATITNPALICSRLINQPVVAIENDASPQAEKIVAIWTPKLIDEKTGQRASYTRATAAIAALLAETDHKVIAFVRSRRLSELIANEAREIVGSEGELEVLSYRGGYLPLQRRNIEQMIADGSTKLVVATSALELGIDIGYLDAAVIAGFPGTFSSFRQQIGRVGRSNNHSAAVLVCGPDALDQWISANPKSILTKPLEQAVINPTNPYILKQHLKAACFEGALSLSELEQFRDPFAQSEDSVSQILDELEMQGEVTLRGNKYVTNAQYSPNHQISFRSSGGRQILIAAETGELIGTTEYDKAPATLFEGAIYLHLGQSFRVLSLDLDKDLALVEPYNGKEQTRSMFDTLYKNFDPDTSTSGTGFSLNLGPTQITQTVTGFQVLSSAGEVLSIHPLQMPPTVLNTRAFWLEFTSDLLTEIPSSKLPGALHASEHALIGMMPIFAICDRSDIGGVSKLLHPDPFAPELEGLPVASITIYDGYPGGMGIAELAYEVAFELIKQTARAIRACKCQSGCPACIQSPKCGNLNSPLNKEFSIVLMDKILDSK